ncbi:hypothetical protein [Saccharicrinis fermentans]|uniref:Uncharacterized protein n=1 Tax=Saccharicrinis fermentans DSM 9555 = JCM 21142 TaxID=869213 RepID=W7YM86_9BACT|nr:hypothetical protein [Saccharicrinis fermentans]GAF05776.1 hypothetical protein JCM21142_104528 [Saccharicrinis fermentans DSM 9555 = JCM 21142]
MKEELSSELLALFLPEGILDYFQLMSNSHLNTQPNITTAGLARTIAPGPALARGYNPENALENLLHVEMASKEVTSLLFFNSP